MVLSLSSTETPIESPTETETKNTNAPSGPNQKQNSEDNQTAPESVNNSKVTAPNPANSFVASLWEEYLGDKKPRILFTCLLTVMIGFFFLPQIMSDYSWVAYRGNTVFYFDLFFWIPGCIMLIFISSLILVDGLSCHHFIKEISKEQDFEKLEQYAAVQDFQLLKMRLIGSWTQKNRFLFAAPLVLLLMLTIAKIPLFDNYGNNYRLQLLFVSTLVCMGSFP